MFLVYFFYFNYARVATLLFCVYKDERERAMISKWAKVLECVKNSKDSRKNYYFNFKDFLSDFSHDDQRDELEKVVRVKVLYSC